MSNDPLVSLDGVSLGYGRRVVLRDVSLAIRPGDFWFFVGPNGEGKTTLLKAILGILRPYSGKISLRADFRHGTDVGYVPQRSEMNPTAPTTVREFVLLGLVGLKMSRAEERERIRGALEQVALEDLAGRDFWSLSGGQRQRGLAARALARRPALLVVDEPTNGLDIAAEDALLGSLDRLNRSEGIAVVFVTHDLENALRYGSRFALFGDGTVHAGRNGDVLTPENLARIYGIPLEVSRSSTGDLDIRIPRLADATGRSAR